MLDKIDKGDNLLYAYGFLKIRVPTDSCSNCILIRDEGSSAYEVHCLVWQFKGP